MEPFWIVFQNGHNFGGFVADFPSFRSGPKAPMGPKPFTSMQRILSISLTKYVNIPSGKYIYVHKYVYICVYTYLCKMDEYRYYAGLS